METKARCRGVIGAVVVLGILLGDECLVWGAAGPGTRAAAERTLAELMGAGGDHLMRGDYAAALKAFEAAAGLDPENAEAGFFAGLTLNRLGRHAAALTHLERASRRLGAAGAAGGEYVREVPFEMGWSLLGLHRWKEAVEQLIAFEKAVPGRGQTDEFLGRAYLGLGELDRAEMHLRRALERDPDLKPTVLVYLAAVEDRRKNVAGARATLTRVIQEAPDSPTGQLLRERLAMMRLPAGEQAKPWWLEASLGGGYSSNARGVRARVVDPADPELPEESSAFARFTFDAGYSFMSDAGPPPSDDPFAPRLTFGYSLLSDIYERQDLDADVLDQYAFADAEVPLPGPLAVQVRVWDSFSLVGDEAYRNQLGARGSILWRPAAGFQAEAGYTYAYDDYLVDVPRDIFGGGALNMDAQSHTLTVAATVLVPGTSVEVRAGYFHVWNLAKGDDFDFEADGVFAGVRAPLPWELTAEALYTYSLEEYDDPNTNSNPFAYRRDSIDGLSVRLSRRLGTNADVFVQYDLTQDESNVDVYEYRQHVVSGGVVVRL